MKIKNKLFLSLFVLTFALSLMVRFWQLGPLPPVLNTDEVALGYNAWSILKTGKDEYGQKFPLSLRSFDDYKPAFYAYTIMPMMMVLSKSELAIRLPSALAGVLTTLMVFSLVKKISKNKWLALAAFFLLATLPWHVQYSRTAYEVNLSVFLTVLGFWAFLKAREKGIFLLLSAVSFSLCLYTYQAARLLTPLYVILLGFLFWRDFLGKIKWVLISLAIGLIFVVPLIEILRTPAGQLRPLSVSIFSDSAPKEIFRERLQRDLLSNVPFGSIWHNRRLIYLTPYIKNYFIQFRPEFLFMGDARHHAPDFGLLYFWQIPFIFLGFYFLLRKLPPKMIMLVILWFVISPLAAATAQEAPSSHRLLPLIIPLTIIMAYGLFFSIDYLRRNYSVPKRALLFLIFFIIFISITYYLHMYFVHLPFELPAHYEFGRAEAARETKTLGKDYKKIIVSTKLEEAYIYFLFYTDYDPQTYVSQDGGTVSGGWDEMKNRFGKYEFHLFDSCRNYKLYDKTLLVWPVKEIQSCTKVLKTIKLPNGDPAINIGIYDEKFF